MMDTGNYMANQMSAFNRKQWTSRKENDNI